MVNNLNCEKLKTILESEKDQWEIIDVREIFEWNSGHIENAKLISMGEIIEKENEIDWNKKVLFYCRSGNRSFQVASFFSQKGKDVWNLEGGILGLEEDFGYLVK